MATQRQILPASAVLELKCIAGAPGMRALYWDGDVLYASRGYELLQGKITGAAVVWQTAGHYQPEWWREIICFAARIQALSRWLSRAD